MKRKLYGLGMAVLLSASMLHSSALSQTPSQANSALQNTASRMAFVENKGQWDSNVRYLMQMKGMNAWVTNKGITYDFHIVDAEQKNAVKRKSESPLSTKSEDTQRVRGHVVKMNFERADGKSHAEGRDKLDGYYNYFLGSDQSKWASHVGRYSEVQMDEVYDGIDVRLYIEDNFMRYDLLVEPGADPHKVVVSFEGSDRVQVNDNGELVLTTSVGDIVQQKLLAYQEVNGKQQKVECRFAIAQDNKVKFVLGAYDTQKPLVIDPLVYSTFLGNSSPDQGLDIATMSNGEAFVTGYTESSSYPIISGSYDISYNGFRDVFVTHLNAAGSALIYSTYIGGSDDEYGYGIAVNSSGEAFVVGRTASTNYPTVSAYDAIFNGGAEDAFITKLNAAGTSLVYSTYLGGSRNERAADVVINSSDEAFITGGTSSADFPTIAGSYDVSYNGIYHSGSIPYDYDVFVVRMRANGSSPFYSTYIGSTEDELGEAITVDASNRAYVTGYTYSSGFPTASAYDASFNSTTGNHDAFVLRLVSSGKSLNYSTFIGGSGEDVGYGIAVNSANEAFIAGRTSSSNYPTAGSSYDATSNGNQDAMVSKLSATGSALLYSTYLGSSDSDIAFEIAIDATDGMYIVGETYSSNYPVTAGCHDNTLGGTSDAFVTKINSGGSTLDYSTFLGGSNSDAAYSLALEGTSTVYVCGQTNSSNYPTVAGSFDVSYATNGDAFVTKMTLIASGSLSYSTYVGGSSLDEGHDIAIDNAGNAYITGFTKSMNYPTTVGSYDQTLAGLEDAFITKLNPGGTALVYSTYIGGDDIDNGFSIALDKNNNAYITGRTNSWNFPTTLGCYDNSWNGLDDAFILKLNTSGSALVYSTFVGGNDDDDIGYGIAVDDLNRAYITGVTYSVNFPTLFAIDNIANGASDAFVVGLDATGSSLMFSTFLGGANNETGEGIAVDPSRYIYLTGYTNSADYPTTPGAFDVTLNDPTADAFVTVLGPGGTVLNYSTYLGGTLSDHAYDIALGTGGVYVAGFTQSTNFPVTSAAYDKTFNGWTSDVFVTKLDLYNNTLGYSTYIGGGAEEIAYGITVDQFGAALVTGYVSSTNYPVTSSAYDGSFNGSYDVFVSKLNADGSHMIYSTYLGGSSEDRGYGIAVNTAGDAFITGWTESADFPTTVGAWDQTYNGLRDAFVTKLPTASPDIVVNGKVFLEGPYSGGSMSTALNSLGYLPLTDPYATVGVASIPSASIVDWVRIELRSTVDPTHIITAKSCFLRNDGILLDLAGTAGISFSSSIAPAGSYYLVVNHRNHLSIMSAAPLSLSPTSSTYDFTTALAQAYMSFQNPMNAVGAGVYGMVAADVDRNGLVDAVDRASILSTMSLMGYNDEDANMNGTVDLPDDTLSINNAFRATQVP